MTLQRRWIDAPSTDNPFRYLHRTRVLLDGSDSDIAEDPLTGPYTRYRVYFLEGNVVSAMVDCRCLGGGWPLDTYIQHPFSGKRSF